MKIFFPPYCVRYSTYNWDINNRYDDNDADLVLPDEQGTDSSLQASESSASDAASQSTWSDIISHAKAARYECKSETTKQRVTLSQQVDLDELEVLEKIGGGR